MKEQMKETILVQSFNLIKELKVIVQRQQLQIDILVDDVIKLKNKINTSEK
tara:strand:+ start:91 stop:243 length:153 start_codon:yes stop_codon:yes gene_type:complete